MIHHTPGDSGRLLVLHRSCLTPLHQDDKWLRTNIFRSSCTIKDRVCSFVIDSGSCRNVVSEEAVEKLGITREKQPASYNLGWLNNKESIRITQRAIVPFSVGKHYSDRIYWDIAPVNFCHLLLGRPWEFDRKIIHDGLKIRIASCGTIVTSFSSQHRRHQRVLLHQQHNTTNQKRWQPHSPHHSCVPINHSSRNFVMKVLHLPSFHQLHTVFLQHHSPHLWTWCYKNSSTYSLPNYPKTPTTSRYTTPNRFSSRSNVT